jgi:hypothetical protein
VAVQQKDPMARVNAAVSDTSHAEKTLSALEAKSERFQKAQRLAGERVGAVA